MREAKPFHIGDILTITTGRLVSPRHMEGVYDILNHMTGDKLFTHQLPRAAEVCRPILLSDHPYLVEWGKRLEEGLNKFQSTDIGQVMLLLLPFVEQVGCSDLNVLPLSDEQWLHIDPLKELGAMVGEDKIVVVDVNELF